MTKTKTVKKQAKAGKVIEKGELIPVKEDKEVEPVENICMPKGLSVHGLAVLLAEGKSIPEIRRVYNCSYQAVHQFIERHANQLQALSEGDKVLSYKLMNTVHSIIDSVEERDLKKAGLQSKLTAVGIAIDKARLLQDKSTSNVQSLSRIISAADGEFLASLGINKPDPA